MDDDGSQRRRDGRNPRGPRRDRRGGDQPRWRRALQWLLGDHEDVDQRGLLAERTLGVRRRPAPADEHGEDPRTEPPR